jgi:hypothetical protein
VIAFKTNRLAYEFHLNHATLRAMIDWIIDKGFWPLQTLTITSVHRDATEQTQVNPSMSGRSAHGVIPVRANDVRTMGAEEDELKEAVRRINKAWSYDHKRPHLNCAVLEHNHVHLQVHENTTFESDS